ncbi:MAG: TRAP transporter fused permease subunit [Rhizobiales bacterium]|nr:TRAP transporter fused permease subunit [Hyphomicrobiales bacterium]
MRVLAGFMAILLPLGTIAYSADLFRMVGLLFYPEQFFGAMFGLAMALCYLHMPAGPGRARQGPCPWYDMVAAALSLAGGIHIALRYPVLTEHVAEVPLEGLVTAAIFCVLIIEGVRRSAGAPIAIVAGAFVVLALVADLLPGTLTGRPVEIGRLAYYLIWDSTAVLGLPMMIITSIVVCFVLFGQALFQSGGSGFFTDISMVLMGRFRGGPAKIAIVASSLFGTISGSVVANVVSTGVVTIPLMKDAGYRPHVAGAIEAVASTGGQLMPPVMGVAAFIMAEFLEISYAEVAIAAAIPAVLYYAALFIQADLEAVKFNISRVPEHLIPSGIKVLKEGWHFPLPFVVLISAIFWWNYPLDTSALVATAMVVISAMTLGYKGRRIRTPDLINILRTTGFNVIDIFMIGAAAGMVIGVLNISGLGFGLTLSLVQLAGGSLIILLLLAAIVSIILGMGMPTVGVYILLATLVAPALIEMKIDPIAAHMFIMYFGMMSMITPPVCVGAFAAATIAEAPPMRTGYAAMRFGWTAFVIPFMFVFSGTLLFKGDALHVGIDFVAAVAGVWAVSAAMMGQAFRPMAVVNRVLFAAAGVCLIVPFQAFTGGRMLNIVGAALLGALLISEVMLRRRLREPRVAETL